MNLLDYLWKKVDIECCNGKTYKGYYVTAYCSADDNIDADDYIERNEESIGIKPDKKSKSGIELYKSEIKTIKLL
ncbi:MAG: hypothetical protein PUG48_03465 [Clostridia bacterium]|nr:hypothetical protein [Clostridia bacterium]